LKKHPYELFAFRNTPHSVTGVSPDELIFFLRKQRTKLPYLISLDQPKHDFRECGYQQKEKGKLYADEKRGAAKSEIMPRNKVLLQQDQRNKLTTRYNPEPCIMKEIKGK
jgi:hypothetical protein